MCCRAAFFLLSFCLARLCSRNMDGLAEANQILLVGSANNLESVDRAVLDRFDLKIEFPLPEGDQLQAALALLCDATLT